jgi:hypothetical protein
MTVTDAGMELCGVIESEEELQEWLELTFESAGWTAIREVSPHGSNYQADLIVRDDEFGWFGIETKFVGDSQGPAVMAKAHHQIVEKYRGRKYLNNKIDLWCVCPYIQYANIEHGRGEDDEDRRQRRDYEKMKRRQVQGTRPFFSQSGIGWVSLDTYSLDMEFVQSRGYGTVPTGHVVNPTDYEENMVTYASIVRDRYEECDMSKIREWAHKRASTHHYGNDDPVRSVSEVAE